jgi:hypothetical protein
MSQLFSKLFWVGVLERLVKTLGQSLLGAMTAAMVAAAQAGSAVSINWKLTLLGAGFAALYSLCTSFAGLQLSGNEPAALASAATQHGQHEAE